MTATATTVTIMARRDMMMNGSHVFKKPPILYMFQREGGVRREVENNL